MKTVDAGGFGGVEANIQAPEQYVEDNLEQKTFRAVLIIHIQDSAAEYRVPYLARIHKSTK